MGYLQGQSGQRSRGHERQRPVLQERRLFRSVAELLTLNSDIHETISISLAPHGDNLRLRMQRLRRFATQRTSRRHQGADRKTSRPHRLAQQSTRRPERTDIGQRHHGDDRRLRRQLYHHLQGQQERGEEHRTGHCRPDAQRPAARYRTRPAEQSILLDRNG